jgi:regulator of sirC expression with transglutaminase-like and TPR domain
MPKPQYCRQSAYDLFRLQMPIIESTDGLLYAAVAIAMNHLEVCTPRLADDLIDQYATVIRSRVRSGAPQALLAHLHDVFFEELGFVGNSDDYYNPLNSYVPAVLQTRKGLPITLSLIYKVIAERIGLSVVGVNAPLHFMAGVQMDDKVLLIDPFFGGRAVSREEAFERIEQVAGRAVPRVDEMLPVASHRQWIARILGNLLNLFQHTEQMCDYRAMLELRGVLMTEC